jgi:hypothetical protein
MTAVAIQPPISMGRDAVSRPMMRPFAAISMMTAMTGAAITPFTTALQWSARTRFKPVKFRAARQGRHCDRGVAENQLKGRRLGMRQPLTVAILNAAGVVKGAGQSQYGSSAR